MTPENRKAIAQKTKQISDLNKELAALDGKRLENAEWMAAGDSPLPHDPLELHNASQAIRTQIRRLEAEIAVLEEV